MSFRRNVRKYLPAAQDAPALLLTLILPPAIFIYEVLYVIPAVKASNIHIYIGIFLLHNVGGNAIYGILSGPRSFVRNIKPPSHLEDWELCQTCDKPAPPRSWHCGVCKVCVLKRDHHCNFFGQCIGYYNHRYFFMFVFYVFISTLYAFCFNFCYMTYFFEWNALSWISMFKFLFPFAGIAMSFTEESFHILYFIVSLIVTLFSGFLFVYHGRIILRGQVTPEWKKQFVDKYNYGWRDNLREVFGDRWYITWLSPLVSSNLQGEGIYWKIRNIKEDDVKAL